MIIITAEARSDYSEVWEDKDRALVRKRFNLSKLRFTHDYNHTSFCQTKNKSFAKKVGHLKYTNIEEGASFPTRPPSEGVSDVWWEGHSFPTEVKVYDNPLYCGDITNLSYLDGDIEDLMGYDIPHFLHGHLPIFNYEGDSIKVKLCVMREGKLRVFDLVYYCFKIDTYYRYGKDENYISVRHTGYFARDNAFHKKRRERLKKTFFKEGRGLKYGNLKEYVMHDMTMHNFGKEQMEEAGWLDNICCYANA